MNTRRARCKSAVQPLPWLAVLLLFPALTAAQAPQAATSASGPLKLGGITVSGSVRFRVESWNWFDGSADGAYAYPQYILRLSLSQKTKRLDWQIEAAQPSLFALPENAVAAGAQGQFGFGATYFVANNRHRNVGSAFIKQAFVRFTQLGRREGFSVRFGRFEFIDGTEVTPKDASLAWIKGQRIAHRLLGNFAFTDVGRSFDGVHLNLNGPRTNFTLAVMRPTRGVFQVDGWGEMDVDVAYAALTRQTAHQGGAGEWRVFGLAYHDGRRTVKTDNRPLAVRAADVQKIRMGTFGAHYIHNFTTQKNGTMDLLLWGAVQTGKWGALNHRAGVFAAEAGWQPPLPVVKPWIRIGYLWGSGDGDPGDGSHTTFFHVLPTPRVYARFPIFNFQNVRDISGTLLLRPHAKLVVRTELHRLRLAERGDLWYQGGGAFQNTSFGYVGRPSGGHHNFGLLWDASADYQMNARVSIGVYFGALWGGTLIRSLYPAGQTAQFGFTELTYRF